MDWRAALAWTLEQDDRPDVVGIIEPQPSDLTYLKELGFDARPGVRPGGVDLLIHPAPATLEVAEVYRFALGGRGALLVPVDGAWMWIQANGDRRAIE